MCATNASHTEKLNVVVVALKTWKRTVEMVQMINSDDWLLSQRAWGSIPRMYMAAHKHL